MSEKLSHTLVVLALIAASVTLALTHHHFGAWGFGLLSVLGVLAI